MINPEMQNSFWGAEDPAVFMSHLAVQVISQAMCSLGHNFLEGGEKELVVLWSRALWCMLLIKLRLKQVPETDSCVYRTNWKQGVWQCRRWECRVLVACREGNWVLCNTLLHFFRARHSFLRSQKWNLETLQWCSRGHSKQQSAKPLTLGVLGSVCSSLLASFFLIPRLQTVLVVFRPHGMGHDLNCFT